MPKFILIILLALAAGGKEGNTNKDVIKRDTGIIYSQAAIDFESGQPVFTSDLKVTLFRKLNKDGVRVVVNDSLDVELFSEVIELYDLIDFTVGTYTVMVGEDDKAETFGFTIR